MNDKTLGAYKRTTPDPDETTGEALARLQAELTRLLAEADAELRDEADGGVAAALIEKEAEESDATPADARQYLADRDEQQRLGRMVEEVRDGGHTMQVGRVMIAPCDEHGRTRAEVTALVNGSRAAGERDEARATLEDLREQYGTAVREKDEWEANAEKAEARADAAESRPLTPDAISDQLVDYVHEDYFWSTEDRVRLEKPALKHALLDAVKRLAEPEQRPAWLYAPAVRAWHKNDGRTEHDGTPGKPRIWSPDYGTTETWSTPSLREVPWTDLVDVEPLDVSAELTEGLDRVAEFMRTGGVRVAPEDGAA